MSYFHTVCMSLRLSLRNLMREKTYGIVSIVGIAVAMACATMVSAYIIEQYRYVNYYEDGHRIYRVLKEVRTDSGSRFGDWVSGGATVALRELFPEEVEISARATVSYFTRRWIRAGKVTLGQFFCRADPELLDVFGFKMIRGHLSSDPMTVIVTEQVATKFFGDEDPIGKVVTLLDAGPMGDYKITGILEDIPKYATLKIDFVTTAPPTDYVVEEQSMWEGWRGDLWGPKNFVRLAEGMSPYPVERVLNEMMRRSIRQEIATKTTLHLQPMTKMRLYGEGGSGGRIDTVKMYVSITGILIAIACANFLNLAVARTVARSREIASRKALGANRADIFCQFMAEVITIALIALGLGVALTTFAPGADFFGGHLTGADLVEWKLVVAVVAVTLIVGLIAGAYPALLASRIRVTESGIGYGRITAGGISVRNALLVGQLGCAVLFIACALVVKNQIWRMESSDVGFDKERVLTTRYVFNDSTLKSKREIIKRALVQIPGVEAATTLWPGPGMETVNQSAYREEDPLTEFQVQTLGVDPDFLATYGVSCWQGETSDPIRPKKEEAEFVLNETAQ